MALNKKLINSVIKALNILECFSYENKELKLTEIATMLEMPKSTTSNLIYTLESMGYIDQNNDTGLFTLGSKLLKLGKLYEYNTNVLEISKPYMKELLDKYNENIKLVIPYYDNGLLECVCVEKMDGEHPITINPKYKVGLPLHLSASGRILLSFSNKEIFNKTLDSINLFKETKYTLTDTSDFIKEITKIRKNKYSVIDEEGAIGITSIAAPIIDYRNEVIGALSIIAPTSRVKDIKSEIVLNLKESCMEISRKLGCIHY